MTKNWTTREKVERLVDLNNQLTLTQQVKCLDISRGSLYYQRVPVSQKELEIKNQIDEIYTKWPFYGVRRMTHEIRDIRKEAVNHKRIAKYMKEMGLQAVYPGPKTSTPHPAHQIYPYLLRGVTASYPNHIWGTDITYIRILGGFVYLVAFLDWYSRFVLSWRVSLSLEDDFVIEAGEEALNFFGNPTFSNQDQGAQFTSKDYLSIWNQKQTKISMDGRGRCMDNIFTERLWRSVKYEEVYLKSYQTPAQAEAQIGAYFEFYNYQRKHQSLGYQAPADVYFNERTVS